MEYISAPLEIPISRYKGFYDLGYYRIKVLQGKNAYIYIESLRENSPSGLYLNLLVRSLFVSGDIPLRKPFLSLEIDDCGMYETRDCLGDVITAGAQAYVNSLNAANPYNLKPMYGFTTSYFSCSPEIEEIFSLLKNNEVQVANHGYEHCFTFTDPDALAQEILRANTDIETMWGEPPKVILVPCHEMCQRPMAKALRNMAPQVVGALDRGYTFGIFEEVFFFERTSIQLHSNAVENAPPFQSLFLYSRPVPPCVHAVTHIFNFITEGPAYQYIEDALQYFVSIGCTPSDAETMVEEDFFWSTVDLETLKKRKYVRY